MFILEVAAGVFIAGLILWWIIRSDLKKMDFEKRMREENAKPDVLIETDRREAEAIKRSSKAFCLRREQHLKLCQDQCRSAQGAEGLLPIEVVSRIFNWHPYRTGNGKTAYSYYGMVGQGRPDGGECYADGSSPDDPNPFPKPASEGIFSASDLIEWLEKERRENLRKEKELFISRE